MGDFDSMATIAKSTDLVTAPSTASNDELSVAVLTGCQDRPYAHGLVMALISKGVHVDMIGSDEEDSPDLHVTPNLRFLNFRGSQNECDKFATKLYKLTLYYARLVRYVTRFKP